MHTQTRPETPSHPILPRIEVSEDLSSEVSHALNHRPSLPGSLALSSRLCPPRGFAHRPTTAISVGDSKSRDLTKSSPSKSDRKSRPRKHARKHGCTAQLSCSESRTHQIRELNARCSKKDGCYDHIHHRCGRSEFKGAEVATSPGAGCAVVRSIFDPGYLFLEQAYHEERECQAAVVQLHG